MESKPAEAENDSHPTALENDRLADLNDVKDALPTAESAAHPAGDASSSSSNNDAAALQPSTSQSPARQPVAQSHPELMRIMQEAIDAGRSGRRHGPSRETTDSHKFWSTQPMPKYEEKVPTDINEAIEVKTVEEVRKEPYNLPSGFYWDVMDVNNKETLEELYQLLHDNYVEDDDAMFRFRYSHDFLLWALKPPHWTPQWHIGVRVNETKKLVGFISAVPAQIRVRGKSLAMSEVNFLCVHKKLREKRMAVILIKEITRRCNVINVFQAVYTAGAVLPKPVGTCRYWHRSLNPQKLVDVSFSSVGKNMTIQRMKKLYRLPDEPKTSGFRPTQAKDIPGIHKLLTEYLQKFELAPEFTLEEVEHYFLPKEKIVYSFVVDNGKAITDFSSFYSLPSTVVNHTLHDSIYAGYSFYNVATKTSWEDLMFDTIIMAKKNGFDVFNALDLMDNMQFIQQLKFGIGDGNLNYYVYNWKCSEMEPAQIGLVLM
ncbi:glycylpeptide N-tetradecanoyltransferase 1-like [Paramacrobiotus metropolitanus]|uniref:glycylpeptide N-tetradecanoyltransferase 1-like n=1 Tax=Paramacrobiotus metropolitanus TaxID=2943436 RepID=UPI0024462802|nr:glycylpeptide N-tetradecanoyltransferase 1-like [Paramacrobiotus metropolitanus]